MAGMLSASLCGAMKRERNGAWGERRGGGEVRMKARHAVVTHVYVEGVGGVERDTKTWRERGGGGVRNREGGEG